MTSLALLASRPLFPALRALAASNAEALPRWARLFANPRPFAFAVPAVLSLPSIQSLLELFPPFLLAVPKKKVSHSRKSMRSANKGLKDKTNIVNCAGCGSPKLAHNICPACYSAVNRAWKQRSAAPPSL
ncbi:hypothetical protein BOTBODRAFT_38422 [Botryobasidium botryosum FD-172 SS1]|uniref:Large ribosomal subunit protein bL32m n=1 Tax=Botryobasidium botryosum (strain FD-172 SS1) TaxID=930990 RepID=A0A067LZR4_BOTB1|nr:hypothetical protein BOTBODRAFT_38422 [Botryobasidium botryosum FD-172 SS1]